MHAPSHGHAPTATLRFIKPWAAVGATSHPSQSCVANVSRDSGACMSRRPCRRSHDILTALDWPRLLMVSAVVHRLVKRSIISVVINCQR